MFKVDAPMHADYWLGNDSIASYTGADLRVRFPKDRLDNEIIDFPDENSMP